LGSSLRGVRLCVVVGALLVARSAAGADRHVYLDRTGDGHLNDCPNPTHNAKLLPGNTDKLSYCLGGSQDGKIIGLAVGTTTSVLCSAGGGAVNQVRNGVQADVDRDGVKEFVYGHPQACVYNMAKSDSCEIHAGTYQKAGAYADANALDSGMGSGSGCDKHTCWWATVVAYGYGPNMTGTGYGTASSPGYLRGAVMNGSTDTWDSNNNKVPDTEPGEPPGYPAVFSGDLNGNGTFEATMCDDASCSGGDAFYGVQVGCNAGSYDFCKSTHGDWVKVDTSATGSYPTPMNTGGKNVNYLTIKDIEFRSYNGGHASGSTGVRAREGIIALEGVGTSDGLLVDHIYMHDSDYTLQASQENFWANFSDSHNGNCSGFTEIKNSLLFQNNEKIVDDDCGGAGNKCGCTKNFHDNRVVVDITSSRASSRALIAPFYYKAIDTSGPLDKPKAPRIWNNEFVLNRVTSGGSMKFMDLQAFGNNSGSGLGELWVYGNVFRAASGSSAKFARFWFGSCGAGSGAYKLYFFGNTFDMTYGSNSDGIYQACTESGTRVVEKNNVYWSGTTNINTHETTASTAIRVNEFCSTTDTSCTVPSLTARNAWWNYVTAPGLYNGLPAYVTKPGGPLDNLSTNNPCDPDGNGVAGVDYNGDGVNDTTWQDIAGNTVNCPTVSTHISAGAIQSGAPGSGDTTPPANVSGVKRTDKKP
jgi:hypothetical protein